ncbi:MAG TPA: acetoacetate decarboxylase family protein, partial [Acidimicrobiia bacterium]|nr:acetoacetate decarboxylase family protein [Acidimicrobiia bacterium]
FVVDAAAAQSLIDYSGLQVAQPLSSRALVSLGFVRYFDSDLGPYHEFAVAVLVRPPGGHGRRSKVAGSFIHQLPVNQAFTLEVGRTVWGFPKWMADIAIETRGRVTWCTLRHEGELVLTLSLSRGVRVPFKGSSVDAYSCLDGVTRRTPWTIDGSGTRMRPGGATLALGDHPMAKELRALGLPKPAITSGSIDTMRATFDAAEVV